MTKEDVIQIIQDAISESDTKRNTYRDQAEIVYADIAHLITLSNAGKSDE